MIKDQANSISDNSNFPDNSKPVFRFLSEFELPGFLLNFNSVKIQVLSINNILEIARGCVEKVGNGQPRSRGSLLPALRSSLSLSRSIGENPGNELGKWSGQCRLLSQ